MDSSFIILSVITAILFMGEFALSILWAPFYYRHGVPLFTKKFSPGHVNLAMRVPYWQQNLPGSWWQPTVIFKQLSHYEFAFRQKWSANSLVAGLIQFDEMSDTVTITGYYYWSLTLLPLVWIIWAITNSIEFFPVSMFIVSFIYAAIQRFMYIQIAKVIEKSLQY